MPTISVHHRRPRGSARAVPAMALVLLVIAPLPASAKRPRRRPAKSAPAVLTHPEQTRAATLKLTTHSPRIHALLDRPPVSLATLVREAVKRHPKLRRRRSLVAASAEVSSRVSSLPDPVLSLSPSNFRIDAPSTSTSPMTGVVVGLSQKILLPGKLARRAAVADAATHVALAELLAQRAAVVLRVRERYWALHLAERALDIIAQHTRIIDQLVGVVTARFGVGTGNQQDVLQAQVAHSRARAWLTEAEQAVTTARRQLNSAVGRAPTAALGSTNQPASVVMNDKRVTDADLARNNPTLRAAEARTRLAKRALIEARYDRWPDLGVALSYRFRGTTPGDASSGADMMSGVVQLSLPVFLAKKQNARVREQGHRVAAAAARVADERLRVTTALRTLSDKLARLKRELVLVKNELLPRADAALNASIGDYQFAKVGFVSVLKNWRTKLDVELWYERLLVRRAIHWAGVRALIERQRDPYADEVGRHMTPTRSAPAKSAPATATSERSTQEPR